MEHRGGPGRVAGSLSGLIEVIIRAVFEEADAHVVRMRRLELERLELESWYAAREIGGDVRKEWAFPWNSERALLLQYQANGFEQFIYEPIHDFDTFRLIAVLNWQLAEAGAPDWARIEIHVGFNVFDSIYRARDGRLQLPGADDPWRGRHFVRLLGWSNEELVFMNSWTDWGDEGRGYMTRDYFERYADHADAARTTVFGPTPSKYNALSENLGKAEWLAEWMSPNPKTVERFARSIGLVFELISYQTVSIDWNCAVEVLELWEPGGGRFAWTHLYHRSGYPRTSVIREFFVAPGHRRQGWGTILEDAAREHAQATGTKYVVAEVQEADGVRDALDRARRFVERRGYSWEEPQQTIRPVLLGRASREV
jgi:GNAT superfamily N-acetyltransferase